MQKYIETCFNYCDREKAFFSSDEKKWIVKMRKLAEAFPDQVKILNQPEDNDGCIYVQLPPSALKVSIRKKTPLTPEMVERFKKLSELSREKRAGKQA